MFAVTFQNDTVCTAARVFAVLYANDPEGEKTWYCAQIDSARRRIDPKDVKSVTRDWA